MTLICFICMTLFHSGDADVPKGHCDREKSLLGAVGNDPLKYGEKIGNLTAKSKREYNNFNYIKKLCNRTCENNIAGAPHSHVNK